VTRSGRRIKKKKKLIRVKRKKEKKKLIGVFYFYRLSCCWQLKYCVSHEGMLK
jgi:hypothetical protein